MREWHVQIAPGRDRARQSMIRKSDHVIEDIARTKSQGAMRLRSRSLRGQRIDQRLSNAFEGTTGCAPAIAVLRSFFSVGGAVGFGAAAVRVSVGFVS